MPDRRLGNAFCEQYREVAIPDAQTAETVFEELVPRWEQAGNRGDMLRTIWGSVEDTYYYVKARGNTSEIPSTEARSPFSDQSPQGLMDLKTDIAIVKSEIERSICSRGSFDLFAIANAIHKRWVESNSVIVQLEGITPNEISSFNSGKPNLKIFSDCAQGSDTFNFYILIKFGEHIRMVEVGSGDTEEPCKGVIAKARKRLSQMIDFTELDDENKLLDLIRAQCIFSHIKRLYNNATIVYEQGFEEYRRLLERVCPLQSREPKRPVTEDE